MGESDLRALHARITKAVAYAARNGSSAKQLRNLLATKVQLEWTIEMGTKSAEEWAAALFKVLANLEGLQRTAEKASLQ